MRRGGRPLIGRYDPTLVLLSVLLAVQGAYVSLALARNIAAETGLRRRLMLAASAFVLGTGIWTMHFVGMLALTLPVPVDYDLLLTLVSALAAILAVGISVTLAVAGPAGTNRLLPASVAMGLGIATMHYLGMAAMRMHADLVHDPAIVALSLVIAVAASGLSLWLAFGHGRRAPLVVAAVAMALAISGMHYTAMWAAHVSGSGRAAPVAAAPAIPSEVLAVIVAVVAFVISAAFLLTLVPDGTGPPKAAAPSADPRDDRIPALKNGATVLLSQADIVSVEADAHYTRLFDGQATYFCGLCISEVERRLDPASFIRVHRSYIVRKQAIAGFRRKGSHGHVCLSCTPPREIPVSRGRILTVQQALGV
ncbi:MAG TPA: MHYT domain-containing protein [Azospirillum sp.]|nr:MHYT domain-containing protein [Azospirillum sp.]